MHNTHSGKIRLGMARDLREEHCTPLRALIGKAGNEPIQFAGSAKGLGCVKGDRDPLSTGEADRLLMHWQLTR